MTVLNARPVLNRILPRAAAGGNVVWGQGASASNVTVRRVADTAENRRKLMAEAAKDKLPSALVDLGSDIALLSSGSLITESRLVRTQGPVLKKGAQVSLDAAMGSVLYTDDGFSELDAKEMVVAVIDTGLDINHPAFKGRVVKPYNVTNGTADVTDRVGHGTHCAGIIAGSGDVTPLAGGVAPQVKIMPVKAADDRGIFTEKDLAAGIRYAVDNGAKVISMSLGGTDPEPAVQKAIQYANAKGALVVVAAGNDGKSGLRFPAQYAEALTVGSSKNGVRSSFSNYGDRLDLSAPGEDIYSTLPGSYGRKSGTSMATPYVAGVAALVMAQHPDWTVEEVKAHLKRSVNDLGAPGKDQSFGYGEVNMFKAVFQGAKPAAPAAPVAPVAPQPSMIDRLRQLLGV